MTRCPHMADRHRKRASGPSHRRSWVGSVIPPLPKRAAGHLPPRKANVGQKAFVHFS